VQIRDTLQNLQRSLQDAGHNIDGIAAARQRWCGSALQSFTTGQEAADANIRHLDTELKEQEAAVEETEGTAMQLQADIALVRHTVNRTEEMLKAWQRDDVQEEGLNASILWNREAMRKTFEADKQLLRAMVENKRQTLASLEGEEEVVLPMLAQLRARVAELRRELMDRKSTSAGRRQLLAELRDGCSRGGERAAAQAAARAAAAVPVSAALQALQKAMGSTTGPLKSAAPAAVPGAPAIGPSFVQLGEDQSSQAAEEDLFDIFGGHPGPAAARVPPPPLPSPVRPETLEDVRRPLPSFPAKNKVRKLLVELQASKGVPDLDQREWCLEENERNQRVLMLAQASVDEMDAEMEVHADSAKQLSGDLDELQASVAVVRAAAEEVANSTAKEEALIASNAKDQALATKILQQALSILADLQAVDGLAAAVAQGTSSAVAALKTAKAAFESTARSSAGIRAEVAATGQRLAQDAEWILDAFERERMSLELARDSHTSQRRHCEEGRRAYEAEVAEANSYLKGLGEECRSTVQKLVEHERSTQVQVLQDSERVLEGRNLPSSRRSPGLRGSTPSSQAVRLSPDMTPLERAAAEMGVAVDGS